MLAACCCLLLVLSPSDGQMTTDQRCFRRQDLANGFETLLEIMGSCADTKKTELSPTPLPRNCQDIYDKGERRNGVYNIRPRDDFSSDVIKPIAVYCDMKTDGGGWLVFQRRKDGSVDFYKDWASYKQGFGYLLGEFWLGNDNLHNITKYQVFELRVDMEAYDGVKAFAKYDAFSIDSELNKYRLTVSGYNGTAGDSFSGHNNHAFSTKDQDNDGSDSNCATTYKGAWWYTSCHASNLNGQYLRGDHPGIFAAGVNWKLFKGYRHSLRFAEMKIRPKYNSP